MSDAVLGAVLVGGVSRRMGTDKAALPLDGTPMAHRVRRALFDGGVGGVVLVGDDGEGGIPDRWPGEGPLAGLATALGHAAAISGIEVVVVAACDQPDLTPELVAHLISALGPSATEAVASAARTGDGRLHPFPSAWRVDAAPDLVELVEAGERRAIAAFDLGTVIEVVAAPEALLDLDTPDDVRRWTERHDRPDRETPGIHT